MYTCPFDNTELKPTEPNGDMRCAKCDRCWYETEAEGEKTIASRPRRVRMLKMPEEGDRIDDVIKPL